MDNDAELAELEAAVYSRAGSAESVVDFIDPVTGETVRATPSELRLRALRAERAEQSAGRGARDRFARHSDSEFAGTESSLLPPTSLGLPGQPHRRFVLPLVAVAAFAAGIVTVLIVTSVLAPIYVPATPVASAGSAPLLIFDFPTRHPDIPVPDLGDQFVPDSIRNVSGTSVAQQGFGVFLGREAVTGLYCLIVHADGVTGSSCATVDDVAQRGLSVGTMVTVRAPVSYDGTLGDNELKAELSAQGDFSMTLSPTEQLSIAPPATSGTTVGTWINGPNANGDFQGAFELHGESLIVALDCFGEGTVTVDLDGEASVFQCRPDRIESFSTTQDTAPGSSSVTVTTHGNLVWGLTLASTPVEPAQG
jgi:hypothetical protein